MTTPYSIAIVGLGKIATDQHLPAIAADSRFTLVANVDPKGGLPGLANFDSLQALLASGIKIDAIALCTPPQVRARIAQDAIAAGLHVLLEKPPAATPNELAALANEAERIGSTLFTGWHSRFAPMVSEARAWLAERVVSAGMVTWREDVQRWHPGQHWLWAPGGPGVFDPGINAFSILTDILPMPARVMVAKLDVPENCHSAIAAQLKLSTGDALIHVDFDFRETQRQVWEIRLETHCGHQLLLSEGGATLAIDNAVPRSGSDAEYPAMYSRFAELIATGQSDIDGAPLALLCDALAMAEVRRVGAFAF